MKVDIRGKTGFLGQALDTGFRNLSEDGKCRLVICAAVQPGRMPPGEAYEVNLQIVRDIILDRSGDNIDHVTYVSSDAVYPFMDEAIDEACPSDPRGAYGRMHFTREKLLEEAFGERLLIVRPTMIIGPGDPHMAYGLNRLCRDAQRGGVVELFGQGEELRDYVWRDDVAEIICRLSAQMVPGVFNVASGTSISFVDAVAYLEEKLGRLDVRSLERQQPVRHRSFDISKLRHALPGLLLKTPREQIDHLLALS